MPRTACAPALAAATAPPPPPYERARRFIARAHAIPLGQHRPIVMAARCSNFYAAHAIVRDAVERHIPPAAYQELLRAAYAGVDRDFGTLIRVVASFLAVSDVASLPAEAAAVYAPFEPFVPAASLGDELPPPRPALAPTAAHFAVRLRRVSGGAYVLEVGDRDGNRELTCVPVPLAGAADTIGLAAELHVAIDLATRAVTVTSAPARVAREG